MNNDIERVGRDVDALPVPPFDFSRIQARVNDNSRRSPRPRGIFLTMCLALALPVLAAAAIRYMPVRVVQNPSGGLTILAQRVTGTWHGTPALLTHIARNAPYRVIWPKSMPIEAQLGPVFSAESAVTLIGYNCPKKRFAQFIIMPRKMPVGVGTRRLPTRLKLVRTQRMYTWTAGTERVRLETNCLTEAQVVRIRAAMIAAGRAPQEQ